MIVQGFTTQEELSQLVKYPNLANLMRKLHTNYGLLFGGWSRGPDYKLSQDREVLVCNKHGIPFGTLTANQTWTTESGAPTSKVMMKLYATYKKGRRNTQYVEFTGIPSYLIKKLDQAVGDKMPKSMMTPEDLATKITCEEERVVTREARVSSISTYELDVELFARMVQRHFDPSFVFDTQDHEALTRWKSKLDKRWEAKSKQDEMLRAMYDKSRFYYVYTTSPSGARYVVFKARAGRTKGGDEAQYSCTLESKVHYCRNLEELRGTEIEDAFFKALMFQTYYRQKSHTNPSSSYDIFSQHDGLNVEEIYPEFEAFSASLNRVYSASGARGVSIVV